jgi:hypothetical protein
MDEKKLPAKEIEIAMTVSNAASLKLKFLKLKP